MTNPAADWLSTRLGKDWSAPPRPPLLPSPTPEELRALRRERGWSAAEAAEAFGMASGRRWREVEAGPFRMDPARWTLGMLSLGLHPTLELVPRTETQQIAPGSPIAPPQA